jgi:hypothetical protein
LNLRRCKIKGSRFFIDFFYKYNALKDGIVFFFKNYGLKDGAFLLSTRLAHTNGEIFLFLRSFTQAALDLGADYLGLFSMRGRPGASARTRWRRCSGG